MPFPFFSTFFQVSIQVSIAGKFLLIFINDDQQRSTTDTQSSFSLQLVELSGLSEGLDIFVSDEFPKPGAACSNHAGGTITPLKSASYIPSPPFFIAGVINLGSQGRFFERGTKLSFKIS